MQRKNSLLNYHSSSRNGIAMVMSIMVIVIVATLMALSLSLSVQTTKKTTDLYLYEQAILLSQSAAEYAMLEASLNNPCSLDGINFTHNAIYTIDVSMRYISFAGTNCDTNATAVVPSLRQASTTYPQSDGTVIMDITIETNATISSEPIRYFRRTIQKL